MYYIHSSSAVISSSPSANTYSTSFLISLPRHTSSSPIPIHPPSPTPPLTHNTPHPHHPSPSPPPPTPPHTPPAAEGRDDPLSGDMKVKSHESDRGGNEGDHEAVGGPLPPSGGPSPRNDSGQPRTDDPDNRGDSSAGQRRSIISSIRHSLFGSRGAQRTDTAGAPAGGRDGVSAGGSHKGR